MYAHLWCSPCSLPRCCASQAAAACRGPPSTPRRGPRRPPRGREVAVHGLRMHDTQCDSCRQKRGSVANMKAGGLVTWAAWPARPLARRRQRAESSPGGWTSPSLRCLVLSGWPRWASTLPWCCQGERVETRIVDAISLCMSANISLLKLQMVVEQRGGARLTPLLGFAAWTTQQCIDVSVFGDEVSVVLHCCC